MTVRETDPRARPTVPPADLDVEQEVDFGRYWSALAARWWLPLLGLVLGAVIGFAVSAGTGGSRPYDATAILYLGQPFSPGGSSQITSLPTRIGFVGQLATSKAIVDRVAARVGLRPGVLAANTRTDTVAALTRGKVETPAPLAEIIVTNPSARKAVDAANLIAQLIAHDFSTYVDVKLRVYQARLVRDRRELTKVNETLAQTLQQQQQLRANFKIDPVAKLVLLANLNNVLQYNQSRQSSLEGGQLSLQELISLATQVEAARVEEPARAVRQPAPSKRSGAVVGAVVGLILGVLAALLWEPLARRARQRPATA